MDIRDARNDVVYSLVLWVSKTGFLFAISLVNGLIRALQPYFDRAAKPGGAGRALKCFQHNASGLIETLVYYAVLLVTLQLGQSRPYPSWRLWAV